MRTSNRFLAAAVLAVALSAGHAASAFIFTPVIPIAANKVLTQISGATGTIITTGTGANSWLRTSAAFDGTTAQIGSVAAGINSSNSGMTNCLGKDWGSGVTRTITKLVITSASDNGFLGGPTASTWEMDGSNDNSTFTTIDSGSTTATTGQTITRTSTITTTTAYRYHRICINGNGVNGVTFAEIVFFDLE